MSHAARSGHEHSTHGLFEQQDYLGLPQAAICLAYALTMNGIDSSL